MNFQRSDPGGKLKKSTYNSYLEKRLGQKIPQCGESDTEEKTNENVFSRYEAVVGNLENEIRQKCFCWTSFVPFNPTMVPYFAESLQVSNLHCGTCKHNTSEYVRGGVEGECFSGLKETCTVTLRGMGWMEGGVTSEIMPPSDAFLSYDRGLVGWERSFRTIISGWEKKNYFFFIGSISFILMARFARNRFISFFCAGLYFFGNTPAQPSPRP